MATPSATRPHFAKSNLSALFWPEKVIANHLIQKEILLPSIMAIAKHPLSISSRIIILLKIKVLIITSLLPFLLPILLPPLPALLEDSIFLSRLIRSLQYQKMRKRKNEFVWKKIKIVKNSFFFFQKFYFILWNKEN